MFVVATPIGNLGDLTRRAEDVLKSVQILAAEDTRRSQVLLEHIGHRVPELVSLHEHNEAQQAERLVERMQGGEDVALVSDAGTPLINDPGFTLVGMAHAAGIPCIPVPGACSITAALSVCPLACQPFTYVGFLPPKAAARKRVLEEVVAAPEASVLLETPHRIEATLSALAELTTRRVMVARELTKKFETISVGRADELVGKVVGKGEFVLVVEADPGAGQNKEARELLKVLLSELPPTKAAKLASTLSGRKKAELYDLAVELSEK